MGNEDERRIPFIYSRTVKVPKTIVVEEAVVARKIVMDKQVAGAEYGSIYLADDISPNISREEAEKLRVNMSQRAAEVMGWDPKKVVSFLGSSAIPIGHIEDDNILAEYKKRKYRKSSGYKPIVDGD